MKVQAEVSLYPLRSTTLLDSIARFVRHLRQCDLEIQVGPMSTRLRGESRDLFRALGEAFDDAAREGDVVLTLKLSNACPPYPES